MTKDADWEKIAPLVAHWAAGHPEHWPYSDDDKLTDADMDRIARAIINCEFVPPFCRSRFLSALDRVTRGKHIGKAAQVT